MGHGVQQVIYTPACVVPRRFAQTMEKKTTKTKEKDKAWEHFVSDAFWEMGG